jgi:uncharacterized protein YegP (UPF0339 family)
LEESGLMGDDQELIFKGADDQFYARLIGRNCEILMSGEGHPTRQGAQRNLRAAVRAALELAPSLITDEINVARQQEEPPPAT